jgi:hypothetical protein
LQTRFAFSNFLIGKTSIGKAKDSEGEQAERIGELKPTLTFLGLLKPPRSPYMPRLCLHNYNFIFIVKKI